jgi:hypothetical protein
MSNYTKAPWKVKSKYYLYNFLAFIFTVYAFTHETMDPLIIEMYPRPDQEKERYIKG